jgi:NhaA family Na+:H+ antiporter
LAWADALTQFGQTEMAGGIVLAGAMVAALVWANANAHSYDAAWGHVLATGSTLPALLRTTQDVGDNGLMTIFFLAIGLEVGREVAEGSLRDRRNALLPVVAAVCGMAGAALVYLISAAILHPPGDIARGWGIPMATDVAFTLGAIALLGPRIPRPLRVFVLALAVADDIASVVVLAVVASTRPHWGWLAAVVVALGAVGLLRRRVRHSWWPYVVAAMVVWYCFVRAGIEPTLSGAFVGLLVPVARDARAGTRLEGPVHYLSSYLVLPLFVLANAGVTFTAAVWRSSDSATVITALVAARSVGKMLGITLGVALLLRLGVCTLPERTTWRHMLGVSLLCGMGITVPLLFAHAVFAARPPLFAGAQIGLIFGTVLAAVGGSAIVLTGRRPPAATPPPDPARATVPAAQADPPTTTGPDTKES